MVDKALGILVDIHRNRQNLTRLFEHPGNLIPFVGAGLSVGFGYLPWDALLTELAPPSPHLPLHISPM
jgi:hypothetical protein